MTKNPKTKIRHLAMLLLPAVATIALGSYELTAGEPDCIITLQNHWETFNFVDLMNAHECQTLDVRCASGSVNYSGQNVYCSTV